MDIVTLALAKKYARLVGMGINNVSIDGTTITFTLNDGSTATMTFPAPADGVSITNVEIDNRNHLICTLSNRQVIDSGQIKTVKGPKGDPGRGIRNIVKTSSSGLIDNYSINYTDDTQSNFQVTNGADATINGYNNLQIVAGNGISITQEGNRLIISTNGVPPTPVEEGQFITSEDEIFITADGDNFLVREDSQMYEQMQTSLAENLIDSEDKNFMSKKGE